MRESPVKYREIVENSNTIILTVQDGNLKFVNKKALELTGYTQEKILDTPFINLVFPEDRKMVEDTYLGHIKKEKSFNTRSLRILKKNSEPLWI